MDIDGTESDPKKRLTRQLIAAIRTATEVEHDLAEELGELRQEAKNLHEAVVGVLVQNENLRQRVEAFHAHRSIASE